MINMALSVLYTHIQYTLKWSPGLLLNVNSRKLISITFTSLID